MIHITASTKNQTFLLRDTWHLIFQGVVPKVEWQERGAAEAQLSLLESGHSVLTPTGGIKCECGRAARDEAHEQETMRKDTDRMLLQLCDHDDAKYHSLVACGHEGCGRVTLHKSGLCLVHRNGVTA